MHVLIVCTANMCRSPMAHALLEAMVRHAGLDDFHVHSAGTMGLLGAPPVDHAVSVCRENRLSLDGFTSTPLSPALVAQADRVLVMEARHRDAVAGMVAPGRPLEIRLVGQYDAEPGDAIPDPVGKSIIDFRRCFLRLERCLGAFMRDLLARGLLVRPEGR